jgi:Tol biopolymer transport system component
MINLNGRHLRDVTKEPFVNGDGPADTTPQVAPDGRWVAFNRCLPGENCEIAVANLRTGHIRNLTSTSLDTQQPNWAPDSKRIVFEYHPADGTINIAVIGRFGHHLRRLTRSSHFWNLDAAYSPDGRWIIYDRYPATGDTTDLYRMRPDGAHQRAITRTRNAYELEPKWMPAR